MADEGQPHRTALWSEIRGILLHDWDPIGVSDVPEAQDEYDAYVGRVYAMVVRHAPKEEISDFLWHVLVTSMGLSGDPAHTARVAERLARLRAE